MVHKQKCSISKKLDALGPASAAIASLFWGERKHHAVGRLCAAVTSFLDEETSQTLGTPRLLVLCPDRGEVVDPDRADRVACVCTTIYTASNNARYLLDVS